MPFFPNHTGCSTRTAYYIVHDVFLYLCVRASHLLPGHRRHYSKVSFISIVSGTRLKFLSGIGFSPLFVRRFFFVPNFALTRAMICVLSALRHTFVRIRLSSPCGDDKPSPQTRWKQVHLSLRPPLPPPPPTHTFAAVYMNTVRTEDRTGCTEKAVHAKYDRQIPVRRDDVDHQRITSVPQAFCSRSIYIH